MYYAKCKREKKSICNLCRKEKSLTWDHVPPKGGIELTTVQMQTVFDLMSGDQERPKLRESQNGVKYRTICKECNDLLGLQYDSTMNNFAIEVGRYLNSSLALPEIVQCPVKPQRLLKALLGHLVAGKVEVENTKFDQIAREYVLDESARLPGGLHVFYWVYPFDCSVTMRDFGMFTPRGRFDEPAIFQMLKYFPIAYLCSEKSEYAELDGFHAYRDYALDEECELTINLRRIHDPYWPESPSDEENNVLFGGQSVVNAIHSIPRKRHRDASNRYSR
jgi:hypothetical protein